MFQLLANGSRRLSRNSRVVQTLFRSNTTFINTARSFTTNNTDMSDQLYLTPVNPATGQVISDIKIDTRSTLEEKYNRVSNFKETWRNTSQKDRATSIIKFRDMLTDRIDSLATDLTNETGKPIVQAKNEIKAVIERINFFLFNFSECLQERVVRTTEKFRESLVYEPLGVVGNISAWNYPYFIGLNVIVPALLTGNCVLYKPSEYSSITGINIMSMLHEAGIPQDAFQVVLGKALISKSMLALPLDGLFFTGSYQTGKSISETLAGRMVKTQLELGGKDAAYVNNDADIGHAIASLADGAMYNTGQSCCSVERIYVHQDVYKNFVEGLVKEISTYFLGFDPKTPATYFGPLTRGQPQVEHLQRLIANATTRGATIALGGNAVPNAPGSFFSPTVLTDVHHGMDIQKEELFGPVVTVQSVTGPEEAVQLMNDTPFGLTGSVYTKDQDVASYIADNSNTGTVYWNACDRVSPYLPWSGRGHSGIGSTLGVEGILTFLKPKARHYISPQPNNFFGQASNSGIVPTATPSQDNIEQFVQDTHDNMDTLENAEEKK
ncbi:hypothetical protein SAMD00019534_039590 [Acytostelium subglobosum LB1]|uniref:hypothetical protein n=1 Tax=Acytostelium subglobosum LB1 TaxID=1410327 RepID=UPI0006451984|nr:hypothetical protein SAMD00019534_039590 [Acytostelium subglobosum LB1]GAM20784.1 hypothetical protein SAMD00019534_039590 [Acytostelium subglobosum LB1]|eukprot:XP_012755918.1 hypothetical protein SAMD00019534_039590 [Acytostelium subglobosum LB1]